MLSRILKQDYSLSILAITLTIIGIFSIYSTGQSIEGERQIIFFIVSLIAYFLIMTFNYKIYKDKKIQIILYILIFSLLALIFILNIRLNNTRRWFVVGKFDIQPAEFAKIVVILISASFFEIFRKTQNILYKILLGFVIVFPIFYLIYKQPALGNSIIIMIIWLSILFASFYDHKKFILIISLFILSTLLIIPFLGINIFNSNINLIFFQINISIFLILILLIYLIYRYAKKTILKPLILITLLVGLIFGFSFKLIVWDHLLKNYQQQRLIGFLNKSSSLNSSINFQTEQSKIAIGSGGLWGKGYAQGTQSRLNFLPEDTTDFIFATLFEEFGFIGALIFFAIYFAFIVRILDIMKNTNNRFGILIIVGGLTLLIVQLFINIGMNMGIMPVTGITLPLVSYGGSSLLTVFIILGIIQNIYISQKHQ